MRRAARRSRHTLCQALAAAAGDLVAVALAILLCWLCLVATPPQSGAANDLEEAAEAARSDMEARP